MNPPSPTRGHVTSVLIAFFIVVLLPYIHIGVINLRIWVPNKPTVDRRECTCSCFDTVFKGSYENPRRRIGYKHVYFNATSNTLKIWVITALFLVLFYESIKHLIHVARTSLLNHLWLILYLVNVYPHYYSWWSLFSYWNDDYYDIFYHHMFFSATEMVSTALVVTMCDAAKEIKPWKLLTILTINIVHVVASGFDQFIAHVIQGEGHAFQISRDVGLMIPDAFHIAAVTYTLCKLKQQHRWEGGSVCSKRDYYLLVMMSLAGFISCWMLRYY